MRLAVMATIALAWSACGTVLPSEPLADTGISCDQIATDLVYEITTHQSCATADDCVYIDIDRSFPYSQFHNPCGSFVERSAIPEINEMIDAWIHNGCQAQCETSDMCPVNCSPLGPAPHPQCRNGKCELFWADD